MTTDSSPYKIFRENLRALLEVRGISQSELATLSGIHQPDISLMLSGKIEPRLSKIERIAKVLDIDWSELLNSEFDVAKYADATKASA